MTTRSGRHSDQKITFQVDVGSSKNWIGQQASIVRDQLKDIVVRNVSAGSTAA
jgi:hypothetical protein